MASLFQQHKMLGKLRVYEANRGCSSEGGRHHHHLGLSNFVSVAKWTDKCWPIIYPTFFTIELSKSCIAAGAETTIGLRCCHRRVAAEAAAEAALAKRCLMLITFGSIRFSTAETAACPPAACGNGWRSSLQSHNLEGGRYAGALAIIVGKEKI